MSCINTSTESHDVFVKPQSSKILKGLPINMIYSTQITSLSMTFHTVKINNFLSKVKLPELKGGRYYQIHVIIT